MSWWRPWRTAESRQEARDETVRAERKLHAGLEAQEAATRELLAILAGMRARPIHERRRRV